MKYNVPGIRIVITQMADSPLQRILFKKQLYEISGDTQYQNCKVRKAFEKQNRFMLAPRGVLGNGCHPWFRNESIKNTT